MREGGREGRNERGRERGRERRTLKVINFIKCLHF